MTLKEIYNTILSNPNNWKYYSQMDVPREYNVESLFGLEENARCFIESYFQSGDKLPVLYDEHVLGMNGRWTHTLSVFLLGIVISKLLNIDILENINGNRKYLYHWYLTCLYHDYGYTIENKSNEYIPFKCTIRSLFDRLGGKHYLRMKNGDAEFSNLVRHKYHNFCIERNFINHGIIGGLLLYSHLLENLYNKISQHDGIKDFYENGLHYSINQKKDFAICADAIIAHNIWFNVSPISDLNLTADNKHTYKHWLTALLVLCDTLEPIKAFKCCNPISILENIEFEIDTNNNSLTIFGNNSCYIYEDYIEKCRSIQDWTYLLPINKNTTSITLNHLRKLYI